MILLCFSIFFNSVVERRDKTKENYQNKNEIFINQSSSNLSKPSSSSSSSSSAATLNSGNGGKSGNSSSVNTTTTTRNSKKRRNSSNTQSSTTTTGTESNHSILDEFIPTTLNGTKLKKTPPRPSSKTSGNYGLQLAKAYLEYVQDLYKHFPSKFNEDRIESWNGFKESVNENTFVYNNSFRNFVKNLNTHLILTKEKRERANANERKRQDKRRRQGKCKCDALVSEQNIDKCEACSKKAALQMRNKFYQVKAEGINCCKCLGSCKLKEDGTCAKCASNLAKKKRSAIISFMKNVQGECVDDENDESDNEKDEKGDDNVDKNDGNVIKCNRCKIEMDNLLQVHGFTLHHTMYKEKDFQKTFPGTVYFVPSLKERGAEWFKTNEKLELLCRPCHQLEHARNVKGGSRWQKYHEIMVHQLGGKCAECGLLFNPEIGKIFHIHHKNHDGKQQRAKATEEIDNDEKEVAKHVNEFKLILKLKGEELKNKLSELTVLCDGCHYYEHMEKHGKSEIIDQGLEEDMLNLLRFQRLLDVAAADGKDDVIEIIDEDCYIIDDVIEIDENDWQNSDEFF